MENINNLLVIGVKEPKIKDVLEKSVMIVPYLAYALKKSRGEIRRLIKQGGIKYVNSKKEQVKLTEKDDMAYGEIVFIIGKKRKLIKLKTTQ